MSNEKELVEAVLRFRQVMDDKHKEFDFIFHSFPRGCCDDVASLLAAYLKDEGLGNFQRILGSHEGQSHAWLEKGELIIDATRDQFDDGESESLVTVNRDWHSKFSDQQTRIPDGDYRLEDDVTRARLGEVYDLICAEI